jgi:hypothetical protein
MCPVGHIIPSSEGSGALATMPSGPPALSQEARAGAGYARRCVVPSVNDCQVRRGHKKLHDTGSAERTVLPGPTRCGIPSGSSARSPKSDFTRVCSRPQGFYVGADICLRRHARILTVWRGECQLSDKASDYCGNDLKIEGKLSGWLTPCRDLAGPYGVYAREAKRGISTFLILDKVLW